jgi:type IV pilus assembly protein PilC
MPNYSYTAVDLAGKKRRGKMVAASAVRVRNDLLGQQLQVLDLKERKSLAKIEITKKKVKPADLMNFSRQLAAFIRSGIPILDALNALVEEISSPVLRQVVVEIIDALGAGATLSDAMAAHSALFPRYYVGILRSAELTGGLDTVLDQLAAYMERDLEAKRAVKSALMYPMVIAGMAVMTVFVLVVFVLPKFEKFFAGFHKQLPLPTRLLLGFSSMLSSNFVFIAGGGSSLFLLTFLFLRTERGKRRRDKVILKLPVLGAVVQFAVVERFCRILGSMLRAGVPVPEAMRASAESANNRVYARALMGAREQMMHGAGLSGPIAATKLFPGAALQMFRVGEESGTLDVQLTLAADYYASELSYKVKRLTTLFEPAVILIMGTIVGFVAVALVSAMYGMFNQANLK